MKRVLIFTSVIILVLMTIKAYSLENFLYKGIAFDNVGQVLPSTAVNIRITIMTSGGVQYQETHAGVETDQFGGFTVEVGTGTLVSGALAGITTTSDMRIKCETNVGGGAWVMSSIQSLTMAVKNPLNNITDFAWGLEGNEGTTPGTNFIGTTDNKTLEIKVDDNTGNYYNSLFVGTNNELYREGSSTAALGIARGANSVDFQTYRTSTNQVASGNNSVIGGGGQNRASGGYATIAGGRASIASSAYSTVAGGYANKALENYSFVGSGNTNTANGENAFVGGGRYNLSNDDYGVVVGGYADTARATYSFIGTGYRNVAENTYSFVGSGYINLAHGYRSFIGNGNQNVADTVAATVVNGFKNEAKGYYSFIGSGYINKITNSYGVIGGGRENTLINSYGVIAGGYLNSISADYATIGGGRENSVSGEYSTIVGGRDNDASGHYNIISAGRENTTSNWYSVIGGGYKNIASGNYSTVAGGGENHATSGSSTIGGGWKNTTSGDYAAIPGGLGNTAPSYCETVIGVYATNYAPASSTTFNANDRLFNIGNGTGAGSRSDAFTVYKSGKTVVNGEIVLKYNSVNTGSNYTIPDHTAIMDIEATAAITVTLPAGTNGQILYVNLRGGNAVTINGTAYTDKKLTFIYANGRWQLFGNL